MGRCIALPTKTRRKDILMKVIIPMAGLGSRFGSVGYIDPKPFINVDGKPMIRQVVDHLGLHQYEHVFVCNSKHIERYNIFDIFKDIKKTVIALDRVTEGAAITVSKARSCLELNEDFMVVNSDQLVFYDKTEVERVRQSNLQGCIWCFEGSGNKWSYARLDETGAVAEVAEKRQISNTATAGMYYFKSWDEYTIALSRMQVKNDRVNNEFYVAPLYNYLSGRTEIRMVDHIEQLGTPEELRAYENKIRLHRNN
jgi:dTDP-glucose pyrophosphorylase